jgi:hypothetical protein
MKVRNMLKNVLNCPLKIAYIMRSIEEGGQASNLNPRKVGTFFGLCEGMNWVALCSGFLCFSFK